MRMHFLFLAICLAGCTSNPTQPDGSTTTRVEVVTTTTQPSPEITMSRKEWKRLTQDCKGVEIPDTGPPKAVEDLAVDAANARKAALEECTTRMRKLRKLRNVR